MSVRKTSLIGLASWFNLEHTMHLESVLFSDNCGVMTKLIADGKLGIKWWYQIVSHWKNYPRSVQSSKTNSLRKKLRQAWNNDFRLDHMIHLDLMFISYNDDITFRERVNMIQLVCNCITMKTINKNRDIEIDKREIDNRNRNWLVKGLWWRGGGLKGTNSEKCLQAHQSVGRIH